MSFPLQDVFSAGCVIAETFLDGKPLFDYAAVRKQRVAWALTDAASVSAHGLCGSTTKETA